jgi:hypothetical protein
LEKYLHILHHNHNIIHSQIPLLYVAFIYFFDYINT